MKKFTRILCVALSLMLACAAFSFTACKPTVGNDLKVTFEVNGETYNSKTVKNGDTVKPPANPTESGFTFQHWYRRADGGSGEGAESIPFNFAKKITGNTTLTAYFTENNGVNYTVTYLTEDEDEFLKVVLREKTTLLSPINHVPTKTGMAFKAWREKEDGEINKSDFNFGRALSRDTTLVAKMVPVKTVTLDTKGGGTLSPMLIEEGECMEEPATPSKSGYIFKHWRLSSDPDTKAFDFATPITDDITLVAVWEVDNKQTETENKTMVLSLGEPDGVFSPFFSSSAYDSEIHGQTQVAMLTSDEKGNVYAGKDVPTVALDYNQTVWAGSKANPSPSEISAITKNKDDARDPAKLRTEYQFLIKNGMKFSDNEPLTIRDVIFNMYVYLDPCYTGSSTMYSTPIVGLNAYRNQNEDDISTGGGSINNTYVQKAYARRSTVANYYSTVDAKTREAYRSEISGNPQREYQMFKDVQWLRKEIWYEILSDWNSFDAIGGSGEYDKDGNEYRSGYVKEEFTETWQIFLYNYGKIIVKYKNNGDVDTNPDGSKMIEYGITKSWFHDKDNLTKIIFNTVVGILDDEEAGNYFSANSGTPNIDLELDSLGTVTGTRFIEVEEVKYEDFAANRAKYVNDDDYLIGRFANEFYELTYNMDAVAKYYGAARKANDEWAKEEQSNAFKDMFASGVKPVPTIKGIEVDIVNKFDGAVSKRELSLTEKHYVLKITIAGVDPKAIWNFGFNVSPMHYYSNAIIGGYNPDEGHLGFNYPGVTEAIGGVTASQLYDGNEENISPGFRTHDIEYFNKVFKDSALLKLPKGAGAFKASNISNSTNPSPSSFFSSGLVYFLANENFKTMGGGADSTLTNCKFLKLRYKVLDQTKVLNSLITREITFGDVNAKQENVTLAQGYSSYLRAQDIANNGYGYVGINARYVPDITARQSIMRAMDTRLVQTYYGSMASIIYRPMSTNSWAYPKNALTKSADYYPFTSETQLKKDIEKDIKDAGFVKSGGIYQKKNEKTGKTDKLEFTFTIAGEAKDHPAYTMFAQAARILNQIGWKVTVYCDSQALPKMAAGTLDVWAAAWNSSIDPDMYQVYHKDSQAQSVNSWGYPFLLDEGYGTDEELEIIDDLSEYIDLARQTLVQEERAMHYEEALNMVMELAVEYPTYQRKNLVVYNTEKIDAKTLNTNITAYAGPLFKIWEVRLKY